MSAAIVRNVFPVVTALAATLYLVTAVPRENGPDMTVAWAAPQVDAPYCVAGGACLDEAGGAAATQRADAAERRASR